MVTVDTNITKEHANSRRLCKTMKFFLFTAFRCGILLPRSFSDGNTELVPGKIFCPMTINEKYVKKTLF